jgi:hypothetical protein
MAVENDSYCAATDVESRAQMGAYAAGTTPTLAQVLDFQAQRAAEIYSWLRDEMGSSAPGPAAYSVTIDTGSDIGLALEDSCIMANALGAAMDALEAAGASQSPARSERVNELGIAYAGMMEVIQRLGNQYNETSTTLSANHFTEGRVTADTFTSRTQPGITIDERTEF